MTSSYFALRERSIRTLAWLGDAAFEQDVRVRLAMSGDWPADELDRMRSKISNAGFQAELFLAIEAELSDEEATLARRGKNAAVRSGGRVQRDVKSYRLATGFEALMAMWLLGDAPARERYETLIAPRLQTAISEHTQKIRERRAKNTT